VDGVLERSLAGAVPGVGAWRAAGLPRPLERGECRRLSASCDRRTALGRRDFAIVVLIGRLGLRCGEVAGLTLDDIDWRAGELLIYGKGHRDERLPLPVDVGSALAAYLRHGRPASALSPGGVRASARSASRGQPRGQPWRKQRCRAASESRRTLPVNAIGDRWRSDGPLFAR
jgi:integrase